MKPKSDMLKSILSIILIVAILLSAIGCIATPSQGGLVISEVVSSNSRSFIHSNLQSPDWIELYNSSNHDIDLSNYIISDKLDGGDKTHLLPKVILKPHSYQLILASKTFDSDFLGMSNITAEGYILVSFGLNKNSDTLVLADANQNIIQSLSIPALDKDYSYTLRDDGSYGFCAFPTPNAPNTYPIFESLELAKSSTSNHSGAEGDNSSSFPIVFNEIVAKNISTLPHADCNDCDWVELYNPTEEPFSLDGLILTDKDFMSDNKPNLDGIIVPANGYLIICCCKDTCVPTDNHICIKLGISKLGETLSIFDIRGMLLASIAVPALNDDVSYAQRDDGTWGYCKVPTPNAKNSTNIMDTPDASAMDSTDPIIINEVLSRNKYSLIDRDGDRSDWVELYNRSDRAVLLGGYYLSDSDDICKWAIPDVTIEPNGYLIIFLSGKSSDSNELHAPFSLGFDDERLTLYDSRNDRIDVFTLAYPEANISMGRDQNGNLVFYGAPTPNALNGYAYAQADEVGFFNTDGLFISEVGTAHKLRSNENDWVELYNGSSAPINLNNYYLSDDLDELSKWAMPNISIEPSRYAVVECTSHSSRLKESVAPFGLSASGEELFISDRDGNIIDVFIAGSVEVGMTCGRVETDNSIKRVFFAEPTKGKPNSSQVYLGYAPQPAFSDATLYRTEPFRLTLKTNRPDAIIYYTTNGSEPTKRSSVYTGPIDISKNTVIRAFACVDGLLDSPIITQHYLFEQPHTVPVVCIAMSPKSFKEVYSVTEHSDIIEEGCYISYYERDGSIAVQFPAGIKAKGRGTLVYGQKSLSIKLRGSYGQAKVNYPFFDDIPYTEFAALTLRAGGQDISKARIRDSYISRAVLGLNIDAAATRPVVLYINGSYWGLYDLNEELNADYLETHYGVDRDATDVIRRNTAVINGSNRDIKRVRSFAVNKDLSRESLYNEFLQWVDADAFMDYVIVQSYTTNTDMFNQKYWRSTDYTVKWRPIFYDLDFCFSSSKGNMMRQYFTESGIASPNGSKSNMDIYCGLYKNASWRERFIERYVEVAIKYFNFERMSKLLDEMAAEMRPEMDRHIKRWGWHNSVEQWEKHIESLRTIVQSRTVYGLKHMQSYFNLSDSKMEELISKYS